MSPRENEVRPNNLRFNADEITLVAKMIEETQTTLELIYYLMEYEGVPSFVLMLLTAQEIELQQLLSKEKRDTDILFEIDKEKSIYAMVCQDTKVDGGYRFAERIIKSIIESKGTEIYCTEIEVRSTRNQIKKVLFKLIETFSKSRREKQTNEIVYKSLT